MRKKINQLAKGVTDEKEPRVVPDRSPIEETVTVGRDFEGEIVLRSENGIPFRGLAYSDDERIEIPQNAFAGLTARIPYLVHGTMLSGASSLSGSFSLVTNAGDLSVPYRLTAARSLLNQEEMPSTVRELGDLAQARPEVMPGLFESDEFIDLPFFKDDSLRALYSALRRSPDRRMALEEFLVACGAKNPVKLTVEADPQTYICREDAYRGELSLNKSGEGYLVVQVESLSPFIRVTKERYVISDFQGDSLHIPLYFLKEKLHAGKNLGSVRVNTGREEKIIAVTLIPERETDSTARRDKQLRRSRLQLAKAAVKLYAGAEKPAGLDAQVIRYLDACDGLYRPDIPEKLMRAELLREMNRKAEEKEVLEQIRATVQRNRTEKTTEYLWFLYLEEEREKGDRLSDGFLRQLYRLKEEEVERAELFPLRCRSDSEWAEQPEKCYLKLREYFLRGEFPLMLRILTVQLLNDYPMLLTRIDDFNRTILLFGARMGALKPTLALRAAELLADQKQYHISYERTLRLLVKTYPEKEFLTALLRVLLRRGEPLAESHEYYVRGIEEDVRLTELYEYYLATLPEDFSGDIPQMVQLYYTYNSPQLLTAKYNLYRFILLRYGPETQMYRLYEKQIRNFALEQLLQGTVSEQAAFFYEKMFIPEVLEPRTAGILSELIYTVHLKLGNAGIEKILVLYGELKDEFAYPVKNGEAYLPIFTKHCRLLFIDRKGNRYAQNVFSRKRLMQADETLAGTIRRLAPDAMPFRLSLCQKAIRGTLTDSEAKNLMQRYVDWDELSDLYREKLIFALVKRGDLNDAESQTLLRALKNSQFLDANAGRLLAESFLARGEDETALEMVQRFGFRTFDTDMLLRMISRQIRLKGYAYEKNFFSVALSLYRTDIWDATTLTYLCRHFNGGTEEMRLLLERAAGGEALYYDLPERLLGQMLFTGDRKRIEWVVELYLKGTKAPNRMLLHAYAVTQSERYFCSEEEIPENIFAYLASWAKSEKKPEQLPLICQIALTRYYSERETLSDEETALAKALLYHLYDQGKFFVYQQNLARFFPLPAELSDKTLIEYRGREDAPVLIGIRVLPQEKDAPFSYSEMPHILKGIYGKPVLLFADEILEYRIERKEEEPRALIQSGRIGGSHGESGNRFARLNRVIEDAAEGKDGWQEEIVEYGKVDVLLKDYFHSV